MILYHCSYIHRTGEICGQRSKSERCYIHRNSPIPTPCRDCVHGGKNDTGRQYLRQLACRHKIGHASSVEHYGVMNNRPIAPTTREKNTKISDIIDLYNY
ncbi:157_t:CDS:2 [Racocetra persica]|uniref:157_t:CDS:1 n=1 Tax=Racocetra persica TaxID=160502 RepID=A0ACA9Q0Z5_9GLOM|nr:157_t:CDS:2 [Racocetra persica]